MAIAYGTLGTCWLDALSVEYGGIGMFACYFPQSPH